MPYFKPALSGPAPFRLEGTPPPDRSHRWIIDPRWFRHLAPKELLRYHATFDFLYREWLGREVQWERSHGEFFAIRPMEIVTAILKGSMLRVPLGDPLPTIEMFVEIHPDGREIAKVLPRWLQRKVTKDDILRRERPPPGTDTDGLTHLESHPTLIMEIAYAHPTERRYQDVRSVFITPAKFLISPKNKLPLTGGRPFTVYCHSFGDIEAEAEPNWFYYGITQRPWQERWAEHARAISAGSPLKFHRTFREASAQGKVSFIGHDVVHVANDLDELESWEEDLVASAWSDPMLLNMIPGGKAGLAYLAKHGLLGNRTRIAPDGRCRGEMRPPGLRKVVVPRAGAAVIAACWTERELMLFQIVNEAPRDRSSRGFVIEITENVAICGGEGPTSNCRGVAALVHVLLNALKPLRTAVSEKRLMGLPYCPFHSIFNRSKSANRR